MQSDFVFTSESTTDGHPDKLCDQISDAIVGRYLHHDPASRIVAECAVSTGLVFLSIKYHGTATVNAADTAREVVRRVGYKDPSFNPKTCTIMTSVHEYEDGEVLDGATLDSADPDSVVARDQATIFGFACTHTPVLMPLPIWLAHRLSARLSAVRKSDLVDYLGPDGKTQVAVEFKKRRPYRIHGITLVASQVRTRTPSQHKLREDLLRHVVTPVFAEESIRPDDATRIAINPEGPFVLGGPAFHAGLTGRKTAVDTYGEFARHSGAALSGKDPARVDRVGAYAARHAAKNVVAAGLADLCEVQLSYSIGIARPVSVQVETWGSAKLPEDAIAARIERCFDFRLASIVKRFKMLELAPRDPDFYQKLACYGHVGRTDLDLPWERIDQVDSLLAAGS